MSSAQNLGTPRLNYVCAYPKSGNTWIRLFCAAYQMGPEGNYQQFVQYDDISKFDFQCVSPVPVDQLGLDTQVMLRPAALMVLARKINAPVLCKSHHASMEVNGMHLWRKQWTDRVVNPVRDPRDVCCSLKDHMGFEDYEQSAEFMDDSEAHIGGDAKLHHILGSWSDHVGSWIRNETVDVHTVRYEDLQQNPEGAFTEILEFLGFEEIDEERLSLAVESVSFERMQRLEEEIGFPERSDHQERFFRKGEVGGWKDELPSEVARKIEEDHEEMMEHFAYL